MSRCTNKFLSYYDLTKNCPFQFLFRHRKKVFILHLLATGPGGRRYAVVVLVALVARTRAPFQFHELGHHLEENTLFD